jgi:hypothetical protein
MLAEDMPVWDRFLSTNPTLFQRIYYDVKVGGLYPTDAGLDPKYAKMYFDVTAKRIDALGERENELWLIEVAAKPGLRATGQIMSYLALWHEDPKIMKPTIPVLVCQAVDADLKRALDFYGVLTRIVD